MIQQNKGKAEGSIFYKTNISSKPFHCLPGVFERKAPPEYLAQVTVHGLEESWLRVALQPVSKLAHTSHLEVVLT